MGTCCASQRSGMMAAAYGSVYVAQVAIGANPAQCVRAFHEAESYRGPSLILAYSNCIAHGIDMTTSMSHQKDLVKCGFWPLYRYDPRSAHDGGHPFRLDSHKPSIRFKDVAMQEGRFAMLMRANPDHAVHLMDLAQRDIDDTWHYYEQLAGVERKIFEGDHLIAIRMSMTLIFPESTLASSASTIRWSYQLVHSRGRSSHSCDCKRLRCRGCIAIHFRGTNRARRNGSGPHARLLAPPRRRQPTTSHSWITTILGQRATLT